MARKTTPVKPPSDRMASTAGKVLAAGRATPTQAKSLAGRVSAEREAVIPDRGGKGKGGKR